MTARPVIIDCDPGQDDAVALLLAFASPEELNLLGVCAVAGNAPLELTEKNARRIAELSGRTDVPVYAGCARPIARPLETAERVHGATGIDGAELPEPSLPLEEKHAVDFLIDTVMASEEGVTLATLGPMTNIGSAMVKEPRIAPKIGEIVAMAGAIGQGNVTPSAEFNVHADPHAARIVFTSGVKLTMMGLDVTHQALSTPQRIDAIRALGGRVSAAVVGMLEFYRERKGQESGLAGAPLHDPCVIAYLLKPELFSGRDLYVEVDIESPETMGRTLCDLRGSRGKAPNAKVIESIDADGFFALLTERLARLPG